MGRRADATNLRLIPEVASTRSVACIPQPAFYWSASFICVHRRASVAASERRKSADGAARFGLRLSFLLLFLPALIRPNILAAEIAALILQSSAGSYRIML